MRTTDLLVAQIFGHLTQHPGAHCFNCMGMISPEHHAPVRKHLESQFQNTHVVEHGYCTSCKQKKEIVRVR